MSIPIGRMNRTRWCSLNWIGMNVGSWCCTMARLIASFARPSAVLQPYSIRFHGAYSLAPSVLRNKSLASFESRSMALVEGGFGGAARVDVCHAFEQ